MNFNSTFIENLNKLAVLTKSIRLLDTCRLQRYIPENSDGGAGISYYMVPEGCPYDKFCKLIKDDEIRELPSAIADAIMAFSLDSSIDKQYLKQIIANKLDLEYDTTNPYTYLWDYLHITFPVGDVERVEGFMLAMPFLREQIELSFGVDLYSKSKSKSVLSHRAVNQKYLHELYDFLIGDAFTNISFKEFERCVAERDFSKIYNSRNALCSKIKYLIYVISRVAGKEWYLDSAHSINTEPQKCSGASVPKLWRKALLAIRP